MRRFNITAALESFDGQTVVVDSPEDMIYRGIEQSLENIDALASLGYKKTTIAGSLESFYPAQSMEGFGTMVADAWRRLVEWIKSLFSSGSSASTAASITAAEEAIEEVTALPTAEEFEMVLLESGLAKRINCYSYLGTFGAYGPLTDSIAANKRLLVSYEKGITKVSKLIEEQIKHTGDKEKTAQIKAELDSALTDWMEAFQSLPSVREIMKAENEPPYAPGTPELARWAMRFMFKELEKPTTEEVAKTLASLYTKEGGAKKVTNRVIAMKDVTDKMEKVTKRTLLPALEKASKAAEPGNQDKELTQMSNFLIACLATSSKTSAHSAKLNERIIAKL